MNRLYESGDFSSSCSSDSDNGSTSDEESNDYRTDASYSKKPTETANCLRKPIRQNVLLKLLNREVKTIFNYYLVGHENRCLLEWYGLGVCYALNKIGFFLMICFHLFEQRTGYFTDKLSHRDKKEAFVRVPHRLKFCLKEIVPYCYLTG